MRMEQIIKGFIEQESYFSRTFPNGSSFRFDASGFGQVYAFHSFLEGIKLAEVAKISYHTEDKRLLYQEVYMRVREILAFETPYSGCVHVKTERFKDGKLWIIEVDDELNGKLVEDLSTNTIYRIDPNNRDDIRAKTYHVRDKAIYLNDGWPIVTNKKN